MKALIVMPLLLSAAFSANNPKRECDPAINMTVSNGQDQYKCSAQGKWVVDEEAAKWLKEYVAHNDKLVWALRNRVLSPKEMEEVERIGPTILVHPMQSYKEEEIQHEFNDLMLTQFKIRLAAEAAKDCAGKGPKQ